MPQFHTDTMWHSCPIFLWIPVDSNSLPLPKETLITSVRNILAVMMKNSPFILAGTTAICYSGAGLEQLKQENENSSRGEEHSQEQARQA